MTGRATKRTSAGNPLVPLVGRREEVRALSSAVGARQFRLIVGPAGIGKTRLLQESLPASVQPFVRLEGPFVLHGLLVDLAENLHCRCTRFPDVRRATSMVLKPLVLDALRQSPRCVVLEDVSGTDPRMYRFLQKVYYAGDGCLVVTARSRDCLGCLRKLLWDPGQEIALKPLHRPEALLLFEEACRVFRLESLDLGEFRRKVLAAAQGNPGQIVAMCRMAARPEYQRGRYIKFLPLRIDVLSALA